MKVYKLFVDDQSYDTEDGYTLYFHEPYALGLAVETALNNGYEDIRISEADTIGKLDYIKRQNELRTEE